MAIVLRQDFGAVSSVFGNAMDEADELASGIVGGFSVWGYKGKVWSIKRGGTDTALVDQNTGDPMNSIELVLVKASTTLSKTFYPDGYSEGQSLRPTCWSSNGSIPDADVESPRCSSCKKCPHDVFGSRMTDNGKKAKACQDTKRIAVVPLNDLDNDALNGPMLLRIPAGSLKELRTYQDMLKGNRIPYFAVGTRVSFDIKEAYPKFLFKPIRPLKDDEALKILELREDDRVARILNEGSEHRDVEEQAVPGIEFEQPAPIAPVAVAPKPAPVVAPKPAPKAAPVSAPKSAPKPSGIAAAVANPEPVKAKVAAKPLPKVEAEIVEEEESYSAPATFEAELDDALENLL